jgi:hypothetical protein
MNRWIKVGKAYTLQDEHSELWVRRMGSRWHVAHRTTQGWITLGRFATLAEAQADGSALMGIGEATA